MLRTIFDDDHDEFRAAVRSFLDRKVRPEVDDYRLTRGIPRDFWVEAGAMGLLGLDIPETYGGSEALDYRFNAILIEELARVTVAMSSSVAIHADVVVPYLVELGTDEQKRRWLPSIASGHTLAAIGMTEPSGGSDLAALRTTAKRTSDGWVLNGGKTFITNGYSADLVVVAARTTPGAGARGISLFLVDTAAPGFRRGRKLDKVGQDEADTAELFFDALELGEDALLGELDRGFHHMMTFLPQERIGCAVTNIAHAAAVLEETLEYCADRTAFGRPIGMFQHNRFRLAELVTTVDVTQTFVDQCVALHADRRLSAVDAAKAKWWSSQVQNDVIDACLQLHGGYGYMNEYRVARAWRDARVTKIWAGSNEVMKELIGRSLGFDERALTS
ncbi:acyl-CoA dehydrogenase family protein [Gordonia paraffinivorans]|uniref:acyl-CoA dehydrogenase family protein n=1 Tax=Gordonia paraffinivorans TaxID=175628 RepID=UPI001447E606|nr:acyl-CoA dehydrogenase family protein [Gordonia paraffinivorans]